MQHHHINPLGLPKGSVRAIIALVVVIVACQQMLTAATPTLLLAETLMIVLTHYFTIRQHDQVASQANTKQDDNKVPNTEPRPLWLPSGSIRGLISLAFVVTVIGLIAQGRLFDSNALTLLGPFAAYLLGFLFRRRTPVDTSAKPGWLARAYIHILAILAILISLTLLLLAFYNILPIVPDWISSLLLSAILYYFGTR